jgi:hypothetical protein
MDEKKKTTYQYRTVPVDFETHRMILALCDAYEMGRRAQGALVRKLVKTEYHRLVEQQDCPNPLFNVVASQSQE